MYPENSTLSFQLCSQSWNHLQSGMAVGSNGETVTWSCHCRFWFSREDGFPDQRLTMKQCRRTFACGYVCTIQHHGNADRTVMPSSSCNSRSSACWGVSPVSIFPPGNSQYPANTLPSGRCAINMLPSGCGRIPTAASTTGGCSAMMVIP